MNTPRNAAPAKAMMENTKMKQTAINQVHQTVERIIKTGMLLCALMLCQLSQAQVTYIHTDGLGSPVAKSDATGNVIVTSTTRYEAYGGTVAGTATPTIGFTGHVNDADTGLTYMQQRYYDPVAGRFLSVDPVTTDENSGASFNRYTYANNNPYKYVDPDGRNGKLAALVRLTANGMRIGARVAKEEAVIARKSGQNVIVDSKQIAKQIETAANGTESQLKHKGHELSDGSKGLPHYQTDGQLGHTFWSATAAVILVGADALDKLATAAEVVDPTTYLTSGNSYVGLDGKTVTYEELMKQVKERDEKKKEKDEPAEKK